MRMWRELQRILFGGNVSRVFVVMILLFSTAITLLLTGLQLWRDYKYDLNLLDQRLEQIRISNLESITQSLWTYNLDSLNIQLEGLVRQQDLVFISVEDAEGEAVTAVGELGDGESVARSYTLTYSHRDTVQLLGILNVHASMTGIYLRLLDTFLVILITQAVKTFLVSIFIIYLFNRLLSRHLSRLVEQLSQGYASGRRFTLERPRTLLNRGDELDTLVTSLNQLYDTIEHEHQQLEQLANYDSLTGLPNRLRLREELESRISRKQPFWLGILDLNDFKSINDTLGHHSGDVVLGEIGQRFGLLRNHRRFFARLGGDEFACIFDGEWDAEAVAATILQQFEAPFQLHAVRMRLDTSIGLAAFPRQAEDAHVLMKYADIAMYNCKKNRNAFSQFSPEMDASSVKRLTLMSEVKTALEQRQFVLFYQPQIEGRSGRVSGVEALIRWRHPTQGFIPPDLFIPSLELSGDMNALTCWVLEQALIDYQLMRVRLEQDISVSINISALNLLDERFLASVEAVLKRYPTRPTIVMEITENALMSDPEYACTTMQALADRGIEFAIDDYGTGYSSMTYLSRLPVSELKIDRSFIADMESEISHFTIVQSTINLASNLGLRVVAEGCETRNSVNILTDLNCDALQGYYFSRPVPIDELIEQLQPVTAVETESS